MVVWETTLVTIGIFGHMGLNNWAQISCNGTVRNSLVSSSPLSDQIIQCFVRRSGSQIFIRSMYFKSVPS
jgi:hypothetical protein